MMNWIIVLLLLFFSSCRIDATCTFPSQLRGVWHGSDLGEAVFLQSQFTLTNKLVKVDSNTLILSQFDVQIFNCEDSLGDIYYITSDVFTQYFAQFQITMCWSLLSVSADKITYYSATAVMLNTTNSRFLLRSTSSSFSLGTDCIVTGPYDKSAIRVLVRDGGLASAKITCPKAFLGKFEYEFDSGSGNECTGDSYLDSCIDQSGLEFNYTMCSAVQAYSAEGLINCVYYVASGDEVYVTVYNADSTTPDELTNFRFSCYVVSAKENSTVIATQYPQACMQNQNSSVYISPGALLTATKLSSCPEITTEDVLSAATIISICVVLLLLISGLIIGFYCWKKAKKNKKVRPDSLTVKAPPVEHFDRVPSSMSRCGAVSPYSPYPTLSEIAVFRFGPSPIPDCDGGTTLGGTIAAGLPEEDIAEAIKRRFDFEMEVENGNYDFGASRPVTQGDPDNVSLPMYSDHGMTTPEPTRIREILEQLENEDDDQEGFVPNMKHIQHSQGKFTFEGDINADQDRGGNSGPTKAHDNAEINEDDHNFIYESTTVEADTTPIVKDG